MQPTHMMHLKNMAGRLLLPLLLVVIASGATTVLGEWVIM